MLIVLLLVVVTALAGPWPELELPVGADPAPEDTAVLVGVDRYFVVDAVPGATRNAEDWYRYLTRTRGVPPARVQLLRDGEATRERILAAAQRAGEQAGPGGRVWFVFIGHGVPTPDGHDGALVGVDAQPEPDALYPRSVLRSEVLTALQANAPVLVLDTCFSGRSSRGPLMEGLQFLVPTWAHQPTDATILAAGGATEFAGPLPGGGRPAFSYLVLGGLLGWADANGDGEITASEVSSFARDALAATVRGRTQTPELSGLDQVLARQASARGPDLAEIVIGAPAPLRPPASAQPELLAELEALHRAQQERIAAERREAELRASLEAQVRRNLDEGRAALLDEASGAWAALAPLLEAGGPEAHAGAEAFLRAYEGAAVVAGEVREPVAVPELDRVRAWLASGDPAAPTLRVTPPDPPPYTPLPWGLWAVDTPRWAEALRDDPARGWDLYLAAWHLPEQVRRACGGCEAQVATAERLLGEAATYGAARGDARLSALDPRELSYLFLGLREETRDTWYAAAGHEAPMLLSAVEGGEPPARAWELQAALVQLGDWANRAREGAPERCAMRVDDLRRALLARLRDLPPEADVQGLLPEAVALARRAVRCGR